MKVKVRREGVFVVVEVRDVDALDGALIPERRTRLLLKVTNRLEGITVRGTRFAIGLNVRSIRLEVVNL